MSEQELHPVQRTYEEHRAYIIEQRDRTEISTPCRQEWQRMLMQLDAAHNRLAGC